MRGITTMENKNKNISLADLGKSLNIASKALEDLSKNILDNPDCINNSVVKLVDTTTEALMLMAKHYKARVEYMRSQQGSETND